MALNDGFEVAMPELSTALRPLPTTGTARRLARLIAGVWLAALVAATPAPAQDTQALFAQGYELYKGGLYKGAIALFEEGLAAEPGNGLAHYYLAECRYKLGDLAQALDHYRQAAALLPAGEEATRSANLALAIEAELGAGTEPAPAPAATTESTVAAAPSSGPDWKAVVADASRLGKAIMDFYNTNKPVKQSRNTTISRVWNIKLEGANDEGAMVGFMVHVEAMGRTPGQFKAAARLAPDGPGYRVVEFLPRQQFNLDSHQF
ncbi:MAG: tetratricopeptide repeat protein [Alphaproteobacteria bacterium]